MGISIPASIHFNTLTLKSGVDFFRDNHGLIRYNKLNYTE